MDKELASGNKGKKGLNLLFHTGDANLQQLADRDGLSLYWPDFLFLGTTSEYSNLSHDENLHMSCVQG